MTDKTFSLDIIDVASPCTADWDKMRGSDRIRHCSQCELNVYHLSNMTRDDAEALVRENEGRICVRFYRRADGTILTRDCPIGVQLVRRQLARLVAGLAAMIALLASSLVIRQRDDSDITSVPKFDFSLPKPTNGKYARLYNRDFKGVSGPLERLADWLDPDVQTRGIKPVATMGK